jgi:hypothetical protein
LWLPAGPHEYLFVADNIWLLDPEADDYVPNVYGTLNAVVNVAPAARFTARCRRRHDQGTTAKPATFEGITVEANGPGPSFEEQL